MKKLLTALILISSVLIIFPSDALALCAGDGTRNPNRTPCVCATNPSNNRAEYYDPTDSTYAAPSGGTSCLANPLGGAGTLQAVIARIVGGLYIFAIPISSIFILWGAFQMMMSQGEAEKIKKGKRTILYAVIGLILMIFASGAGYVINNILSGSVGSSTTCPVGQYFDSTTGTCRGGGR